MRVLPLLILALILSAVSAPAAMAGPTTLADADGLLTGPRSGDAETVAWHWLTDHKAEFGLDTDDLQALKLTKRARSEHRVTRLEWTQTVRGVEGLNATIRINVSRDGRVINAGGDPIPDLSLKSSKPVLSAGTALRIAQRNARVPAGRPSPIDKADLLAIADPGADRLAWRITVAGRGPLVYSTLVDATSGMILKRTLLTDFSSSATVFENHPGAVAGGSPASQDISGYLDPSPTTLAGPNAYAYPDIDDDDTSLGEEIAPSSGENFDFAQIFMAAGSGQSCPTNITPGNSCTWEGLLNGTRDTNRDQRATQLFYFVNKFHDWLETEVGFTPADGNFEGTDPVIAQSDDGYAEDVFELCDHLNNANMFTPPDGDSPIMQLYFFGRRDDCGTGVVPAVSSADDASVVFHEYTHGLSNRLIGNGLGLNSNQSAAMGEGWSDWYAMDYLADPTNGPLEIDTATSGELAIGKYVTNDTTRGIRRAAMDCAVGSAVTACQPVSSLAGPGGYTYADLGRVSSSSSTSVHANGEIWAQTLWDLRTALGAPATRDRVTEAMRLSPTINPSFLDMRNAIISADVVAGGANVDAIWTVFANRGMGCGAKSPSANSTTTVTAAFDMPTPDKSCPPPPPIAPSPEPPSISNARKTARLDRKGRFKFRFNAAPVGAKCSVSFKTTSKYRVGAKRKILSLGSRSVTVSSSGVVEVQIKLGTSARKALERKKKVGVNVAITLGGKKFASRLTLKR